MDAVIFALADAIWPAVWPAVGAATAECQEANLTASASLSGADIKQLPQEVLRTIENCFYGSAQNQLMLLIRLLSRRLPMLLLAGRHCLSLQWPFVRSFPELPLQKRQQLLQHWAHSRIAALRKAYKGLKAIIASAICTSINPATGTNPFFDAMGYVPGTQRVEKSLGPVPGEAAQAEEVLSSATVHIPDLVAKSVNVQAYLQKRGFCVGPQHAANDTPSANGNAHHSGDVQLFYDAVIVGSGAGGGVTAALLAAAGLKVLVLEKASWVRRQDMTWLEADAHNEMYEQAGFLMTQDGAISILAGSTLGGGTKINWTASLHPPKHVRSEWAAPPHGLDILGPDSKQFTEALDAVCKRLGVQTDSEMSGPNQKLLQGMQQLGLHGEVLPRNCLSKKCSAYCNFGCRSGHKQSSDVTWLVDAVRAGAHVLTGVEAQQILLRHRIQAESSSSGSGSGSTIARRSKQAAGVIALSVPRTTPGAATGTLLRLRITVHAPIVVSSCGSVHTPALLLRSGVKVGGNVGRHLRLHPAAGLVGYYAPTPEQKAAGKGAVCSHEIKLQSHELNTRAQGSGAAAKGVSMGSFSRAAGNWSEGGYGAIVSVPAVHPGLLAALCPEQTPGMLKASMLKLQDASATVVFTRDSGSGSVHIDGQGRPVLQYWPDQATQKHLMDGIALAVRYHVAAGAYRVSIPNFYQNWNLLLDPAAPAEQRSQQLEAFIARMHSSGIYPKYGLQLLSAHQMGSCRMGSSPRSSACDASGECWEVSGLYISDASLFPTASGVNPMITIYGLAYLVGSGIAQRWRAARKAQGVSGG